MSSTDYNSRDWMPKRHDADDSLDPLQYLSPPKKLGKLCRLQPGERIIYIDGAPHIFTDKAISSGFGLVSSSCSNFGAKPQLPPAQYLF